MKRSLMFIATLAMSALPAFATVVYDTTTTSTDYIDQQYGNNYYYIGDTVSPLHDGTLTTVSIDFGSTYYDPTFTNGSGFTYTPNITVDLYDNAADAALDNGTGLIGSATTDNVTFTNDGVVAGTPYGYNFEDEQLITFDFTSQNITLPSSFVFAYHDSAPNDSNGTNVGAEGLSVGLTLSNPTVGLSDPGQYFYTYPDAANDPAETLTYSPYGNVKA